MEEPCPPIRRSIPVVSHTVSMSRSTSSRRGVDQVLHFSGLIFVRIGIIGFAPEHNRQSFDLASVLADHGHEVCLLQLSDVTSTTRASEHLRIQKISVRQTGVPRFNGFMLLLAFYARALRNDCEIIVGVNLAGLRVACGVSRIKNTRVLYYALELVTDRWQMVRERQLCLSRCCTGIVCPEENRIRILRERFSRNLEEFLVPNVPRSGIGVPSKGRLRAYLSRECEFYRPGSKIILFHGTYQRYSHLESIIRSTGVWPGDCMCVLMLTSNIPAGVKKLVGRYLHRVCLVPAVPHSELYEWIVDADIGLLPYEDDGDDNVRFCSPQKLFDYAVCGVPVIGSRRPVIAKVVEECNTGVLVDFLNERELALAIEEILKGDNRRVMGLKNRRCYEQTYNYDNMIAPLLDYLKVIQWQSRS